MSGFLRIVIMEWRKQRRSLAGWAVLAGACFTPAAVLLVRLLHADTLPRLYAAPGAWSAYWNSAWESVVVFLLPMGVILVTALLAQIEHRNNTWKQVSVLPVSQATIYAAKLLVVVTLVASFVVVFVLSGTLGALLPVWLVAGVPMPADLSWRVPLVDAARHFVLVLPIVALQFAIGQRVANFLVPVGVGFLAWVAALALLSWQYAWIVPYGHGIRYYMAQQPAQTLPVDTMQLFTVSAAMTLLFVLVGLLVFVRRPVKG